MRSFRRLLLPVLFVLIPSLGYGAGGELEKDLQRQLSQSKAILVKSTSKKLNLEHIVLKVSSEDRTSSVIFPKEAWVSEKVHDLPGLKNVGRVALGIYRGAQPKKEGYATLKQMGIRTVINLRANHGETKDVESAGMRSIEFPMGMFGDVNKGTVQNAIKAMSDPSNQPVFLHCKLGQDRTGIVVAVYRMKEEGWSLKQAESEMQEFGFNDIWVHLMRFVRNYAESIEK